MKWLMSLIVFASFTSANAEVGPEHIETMLMQMVKENVISPVEAEKTKIRMKSLSRDQWVAVNKIAARSPASIPTNNRIEELQGIDLDGDQFKTIQKELRKIAPQYHD